MKTQQIWMLLKNVKVVPFIGKAVIKCRKARKMTQKALADAAGLNESAVKKLEAGRKRGGWLTTLEAVCKALDMKMAVVVEMAEMLAMQAAIVTALADDAKVPS